MMKIDSTNLYKRRNQKNIFLVINEKLKFLIFFCVENDQFKREREPNKIMTNLCINLIVIKINIKKENLNWIQNFLGKFAACGLTKNSSQLDVIYDHRQLNFFFCNIEAKFANCLKWKIIWKFTRKKKHKILLFQVSSLHKNQTTFRFWQNLKKKTTKFIVDIKTFGAKF